MYYKLSYEDLQIVIHFYSLYFFKYLIGKNIACIMIFFFKGGGGLNMYVPVHQQIKKLGEGKGKGGEGEGGEVFCILPIYIIYQQI